MWVELIGSSECDEAEPVPIPLELDVCDEREPDLFRALAPILGKGPLQTDVLKAGMGVGQDRNGSRNSITLTTCCIPANKDKRI